MIPTEALQPASNLQHNGLVPIDRDPHTSLIALAEPYVRRQAFVILQRMARQANAHLPPEQHLQVSSHLLRHTLLRKVANEEGVHYAMELSGHQSNRYIWRDVQPDAQSLADALDELE